MAWVHQEMAVHQGETFRTSRSEAAAGRIWIIQLRDRTYAQDGFEQLGDVRLKQVPIAELDAWYRDRTTATWRGQPFTVSGVHADRASPDYLGRSPLWARENGLEGNQRNGFCVKVNSDERRRCWRWGCRHVDGGIRSGRRDCGRGPRRETRRSD
ncbi:hypothetical protein SAMN04489726_0966 [Allokutzneria albata]|uniref:Uncharacterized protein n=1 Tax=Allokutzneria albata TaxID=211114 RepID=A0A1G9SAH6_ALLAB|nr:hypothetical protein SAMN04489726_0966 [Allokutzneria albata]